MTPSDRDILEILANEGGHRELVLTPRLIAENSDWARDTIREHVVLLRDHNLIEYQDEAAGIYRLSDHGRAYLAGDLDVSELEDEGV
ncbi:ArsR family transcriptional regulator [Halorubellus litoreus]|uniref:ArsR family transcriptional regulator n=1 Tax=Halorubellus litoreus TaxID=755308 RepID=A0ABD5VMD5_9EURY